MPDLPTQPPSLLPNGPQREIPLPGNGGKGGFNLDFTPTPDQQQQARQQNYQNYLKSNPYDQSMGGSQDLYNQYADYAANVNYQPGPIYSHVFREPQSYQDWLTQPGGTPAGFTGGLKTAPANYRPPV